MRDFVTVALKEIKDIFRDRRTVLVAILTGPILFPVLMLGMGTVIERKATAQLEETLKLPVIGAEHAPNLVAWLDGQNVDIEPAPEDPEAAIRNQDEHVILVIPEDFGEQWRASKPALVELMFDSTRQDAQIPIRRVHNLLSGYGDTVGTLRLLARGVDPGVARPVRVGEQDLSTPESRSGQALVFLQYALILFAFLGGAQFMIDATAGERERQSLEPLLATPAARGAIMSGKIAAACAFGLLSLVLMIVGFKVGAEFAPGIASRMDVSFVAALKILAILLPMLLIGTTLMTLISASVKSVKEAQTYMSFLFLIPILPTIYLMISPVKNQLWMFAVPFLSQNQMIMMVLRGEAISAAEWAIYLGAGFGLGLVLWVIAAQLYHREKLAISA